MPNARTRHATQETGKLLKHSNAQVPGRRPFLDTWERHDMEKLSALLSLYAMNLPATRFIQQVTVFLTQINL